MNSNRKRLLVFGIGAVVLLGIALSNSAIIRSIDSAYNKIINSDLSNRKALSSFERSCNVIQNSAVSMLLTEDTTELICLQKEIFTTFNKCDRLLQSIESSDFSQSNYNLIVKFRSEYLLYKESCANLAIKIMEQERKANSIYVTRTLQKQFTKLLAVVDSITTEYESAMVSDTKSLTKQNSLALTFITGAGIVPIVFWGLLLIATFLWTSVALRKLLIFRQ